MLDLKKQPWQRRYINTLNDVRLSIKPVIPRLKRCLSSLTTHCFICMEISIEISMETTLLMLQQSEVSLLF
jgi:hypothetical protein